MKTTPYLCTIEIEIITKSLNINIMKTSNKNAATTVKGAKTTTVKNNKSKEAVKEQLTQEAKNVGGRKKVERNVGDIHSNGLWFWKEIKPGTFDWRVIKKDDTPAVEVKAEPVAEVKPKRAPKAKADVITPSAKAKTNAKKK